MNCLSPIDLINKKTGKKMIVPCGHCLPCRIKKRSEWTFRLKNEQEFSVTSDFVTLTYNNENLPTDFSVHKDDLQTFFKEIRTYLFRHGWKIPVKYYACGEYGGRFGRPHYHAIIYNVPPNTLDSLCRRFWKKGFYKIENCVPETMRYVAGYVCDKLTKKKNFELFGNRTQQFSLQSKGLGLAWALANKDRILQNGYIINNSRKCSLPRYYINKLLPERLTYGTEDFIIYQRWKNDRYNRQLQDAIKLGFSEKTFDEYFNCTADVFQNDYFRHLVTSSWITSHNILTRLNLRKEYSERLKVEDYIEGLPIISMFKPIDVKKMVELVTNALKVA